MKKSKVIFVIGMAVLMSSYSMKMVSGEDDNKEFNQRYQAEDFSSSTGNVYIRSDGEDIPIDSPVIGENIQIDGAEGGKFIDFSDPVRKYATNDMYGSEYQLVDKYTEGDNKNAPKESIVDDTATWNVTVPTSGFYKLSFKYNNPATRVKGYRNDRDERNCRIMINTPVENGDTEEFYTDSNKWTGWMIFNVSGYNDTYDTQTNTSLTPQSDNHYENVIGNKKWNNNYMNVYLEAGDNTITLGIQAPPGQGVYDGPNLDYFDITYIGDTYMTPEEIPYIDSDFIFEHPGIYFTLDDLENMKANKDDIDTVYGKGDQEMKTSKYAKTDYQPSPQTIMNVGPYNSPNYGGTEYTNDGCGAHYNSLMWYLDGNIEHAKTAIEILNGWSSSLETIAEGNDLKLRFSIVGPDYLNAAEILKHIYNKDPNIAENDKWQEDDMQRFEEFIRKLLTKTLEYYPQANGNWDSLIGGFNMATAVYLEDVDIFNKALTQLYIGNIQKGNTASMGALTNYIYDTGESQESNRDATHSRMGITGLAYQAEIAWNQGINLYPAYHNRLLIGTKYNAAYLIGNEVDSTTFISDKNRLQSDISSMAFEIVSNHYINQVEEGEDVSVLIEAANQRLRSGGTKNEAKTEAMYYGAMVFTEVKKPISLTINSDKTIFNTVGESITIKPIVETDSNIKTVRTTITGDLKKYLSKQEHPDGSITLTLIQKPSQECDGDITISTVKNAAVTKSITLSYQLPTISLDQETIVMKVGDTVTLNALVSPISLPITWEVSDDTLVSITNGNIKALKSGEVEVVAKIEGTDIQASCHIRIVEEATGGIENTEQTNTNKEDSINTGDMTNVNMMVVIFGFAAIGLIVYGYKIYRNRNS